MDVQMPIIDGYRATHLIRHHAPYSISARDIPIVAMTASAIQGDREKCKKAGMDDYLAKPVKGKTLEKMLIRWAIHRRTPRTPSDGDYNGSECSESAKHCGVGNIAMFGPEVDVPTLTPRPSMADRQNSQRLTLPDIESEGDRAERRKEAEEKAISLRDDKLVEAAGIRGEGLVPHGENIRAPGQKLTIENMGKLEEEAKATGRSPRSELKKRNLSAAGDSTGAEQSTPEREDDWKNSVERPKLDGKWRDSERTVTGREKE
jgi:CheY-like chemotaxis protein